MRRSTNNTNFILLCSLLLLLLISSSITIITPTEGSTTIISFFRNRISNEIGLIQRINNNKHQQQKQQVNNNAIAISNKKSLQIEKQPQRIMNKTSDFYYGSTTATVKEIREQEQKKMKKRKRQLISFNGKPNNDTEITNEEDPSKRNIKNIDNNVDEQQHPLRTDTWEIYLKPPWFEYILKPFLPFFYGDGITSSILNNNKIRKEKMIQQQKQKHQRIIFHKNGIVKLVKQQNNNTTNDDVCSYYKDSSSIGKWRLDSTGLLWFQFPYSYFCYSKNNNDNNNDKSNVVKKSIMLQYSANVHLNPFGAYPKMSRGIVTRDIHCYFGLWGTGSDSDSNTSRRKIVKFRPVIATFYAKGIGMDTMDTTYKNRNR